MSSKATVSVIIPFLNAEKFIRGAIESVLRQSYDKWELLLIDDGSTDGSTEVALRYAKRHPGKVRYFEHEGHQNRGTCASRNLGIRHASGQYIAPLDADDVWLPHKLEQQVAILISYPEAGMVCGRSQVWYSWTGKAADIQRDSLYEIGSQPNSLVQPPMLLRLSLQRKSATPCPSDILLRREVVERIGGFEEDFRGMYQHCEDQAFLYKVYLKSAVFVSGEYWDRYRIHPDSCSSLLNKGGKGHSVWLFFLNWLERYLISEGVKDAEVWNALHRELWPYRHPTSSRVLRATQQRLRQVKQALELVTRRVMPSSARRWVRARWLRT
jgi:glycosyltransferase involved in cell wall biosynthesis